MRETQLEPLRICSYPTAKALIIRPNTISVVILSFPEIIIEQFNSILSPIPSYFRVPFVIVIIVLIIWIIGRSAEEDTEDEVFELILGLRIVFSGFGRFANFIAPLALTGFIRLSKGLWSVGIATKDRGSQLVEVEEAPIKIGPLVEIYGVRIGLIGIVSIILAIAGWAILKIDISNLPLPF